MYTRILHGNKINMKGSPDGSVSKESAGNAADHLQCKRHRFNPWVRKFPWRRKWQLIPIFLPGKSHEHRSLEGYSLMGLQRIGQGLANKTTRKLYRVGHTTTKPKNK